MEAPLPTRIPQQMMAAIMIIPPNSMCAVGISSNHPASFWVWELSEIKDFNIGEIIIIDKNSTDNTKNIAEKYSVKFITQSREGWGGAVKEAIELCIEDLGSLGKPIPDPTHSVIGSVVIFHES